MRLTRRGRRGNYVVDVVDAVFSHTELDRSLVPTRQGKLEKVRESQCSPRPPSCT